jgi:predicted aspartyl protease
MRPLLCVALSLLLLGHPANAADLNPYAKPADAFGQRLQAAAFGEPGADRALDDWLAEHRDLPREQRLLGFRQLCTDYDALTWFRLRAAACTEYVRLKENSPTDTDRAAVAFADQPPARAIGSTKVPLSWNKFGCQSVAVEANGAGSSWFVDTGAEITVVRAALAKAMRVRMLPGSLGMGTTTADVAGAPGIIDRLRIGNSVVENVPVIVLPDAQLDVPGVGQIDGILGLQVMVAFGRIAWVNGGSVLAFGEAAPKARPGSLRMFWQEEGVGIPVRTARALMGAFLDTGANKTDWRAPGSALLDPRVLASAREQPRRVGGAGGIQELKERRLASVSFELGSAPIRLTNIALSPDERSAAKIGMDAVSQFDTFILDFDQMRIDGSLKSASERNRTRKDVPPK